MKLLFTEMEKWYHDVDSELLQKFTCFLINYLHIIHNTIYFFNNSESDFLTSDVNASSDSHWALNDPDNPYVVLAFVYTPVTGSIFAIFTCTAPKSLAAKIRFVQELVDYSN